MTDHASVRNNLICLTEGLLLGPLDPNEVLPSAPADTYLTGILWPEGSNLGADEDDQSDGAPASDDGETDAGVPGYRAIRPCSLGVTFSAALSAKITVSLANSARYRLVTDEKDGRKKGSDRKWRREPLNYLYDIPATAGGTWRTNEYVSQTGDRLVDPDVQLHIRHRRIDDMQVVTVTLINKAVETDDRQRDEVCLFQAGLEVRAVDQNGRPAICPRPAFSARHGDEDAQSAALLYRDVLEYAVGHGVSTMWTPTPEQRVEVIRTAWMPHINVKGMSAKGHDALKKYAELYPSALEAAWLARTEARKEITTALHDFAGVYAQWIEKTLVERKDKFEGDLAIAAARNLSRCEDACRRIARGVTTLQDSDAAWRAFVLANAAMDRQSRYEAKGEKKGPLVWRPFQLAYILLVLPGLVKSEDKDRDCVDLLWFPTGGGKTEAYLGLTAFQIFFRRLTDAARRNNGGVDVLMRYTLRLLTVQQFQRAASLICACDALRRKMPELGTAQISLGLYVGGDATPNRRADAIDALRQEHDGQQPRSTPRQLLKCPVCDTNLPASCYSEGADGETSIQIRCPNPQCETGGQPLPVMTVDDDIYDRPTSLLIGTIDKFAQLPRRRDLRALFGLDRGPRPGLIIQDELHLISGPLGSMAGLYETVIDLLCTGGNVRPKVIGSTATIGQAARQVRALFDRTVLQFPPSGFEAKDSFFAVRDDIGADRLYLGISSAGRSPKFALQATTAALLQAADHQRQGGVEPKFLDPYWTAVMYFNSLRELGGAHVLLQDDIPRHMTFLASRLDEDRRALESDAIELSSRVPSRELPDFLNQLNISLSDDDDPFADQPRNAVLASNMISVGVDVPRLGLMVVNGQPKSTAEYIQASSRVGRGVAGLVVTHYNFGRPRDVSHFEHFLAYHGALYRSVEATSVTPWAPRARDKALHAVLAAAVRHLVASMDMEVDAAKFDPSHPGIRAIIASISKRAHSASDEIEGPDTEEDLEGIVREWAVRSANARGSGSDLLYWEKKAPFGKTRPYLMTSAEEGARPGKAGWPTPNSMREVEPSTAFALKVIGKK
ncbi:MAG: helicase-related protein [Rhodospirillaceae bacterium]